jgi:hypothetical protein
VIVFALGPSAISIIRLSSVNCFERFLTHGASADKAIFSIVFTISGSRTEKAGSNGTLKMVIIMPAMAL